MRRTIILAAALGGMFLALLLSVSAGFADPASPRGGERGGKPVYLPYRVPIPPGTEISAPPEPYDPAKHGPPLPNTSPEPQTVNDGRTVPPRRTGMSGELPGDGDAGFYVLAGKGIYAGNDAQTDLTIPAEEIGAVIYAPAHMPSSWSCLEAVTEHTRPDYGSTEHRFGFWNHTPCTPGPWGTWAYQEDIDAWFKARYVRTYSGEDVFWTEILKHANGWWRGYLYNFNSGQWEEKTARFGSNNQTQHGWTIWESFGFDSCPSLLGIRAHEVRITLDGTNWPRLGETQGDSGPLSWDPVPSCWPPDGNAYTFHVHNANYNWHAHTPNDN